MVNHETRPYIMTCETCGKPTSRRINSQCVDCYLASNLPSAVDYEEEPWVWANNTQSPKPRKHVKLDEETERLGRAIVEESFELSDDGSSLFLILKSGRYEVPLTVESIDALASRSGILVGKWLVYRHREKIDDAWLTIARATFDRTLGRGAKVSTREKDNKRHVICVYTSNYLDLEDVKRVRGLLRNMGFAEQLCYKPDIYTYLNVYSGTTQLSPCRYRE